MQIFAVTTQIKTPAGGYVWWPFLHAAATLAELHDILVRDRLVTGFRVETERAQGGKPLIAKRKIEIILHRDAVFSVTEMHREIDGLGALT